MGSILDGGKEYSVIIEKEQEKKQSLSVPVKRRKTKNKKRVKTGKRSPENAFAFSPQRKSGVQEKEKRVSGLNRGQLTR